MASRGYVSPLRPPSKRERVLAPAEKIPAHTPELSPEPIWPKDGAPVVGQTLVAVMAPTEGEGGGPGYGLAQAGAAARAQTGAKRPRRLLPSGPPRRF